MSEDARYIQAAGLLADAEKVLKEIADELPPAALKATARYSPRGGGLQTTPFSRLLYHLHLSRHNLETVRSQQKWT